MRRQLFATLLALLYWALPQLALAAGCLPVAGLAPRLMPAAFEIAEAPAAGTVRLTFLGHASFLIESPGGVAAVTDWNGINRPPFLPDIVTMNNAHPLHYVETVEPGIKYALRGWDPAGGLPHHDLTYRDMRVRNVPTNLDEAPLGHANSIFIFEAAELCIAHLGHLHKILSDEQLGALGQVDVLLVPVDGGYTIEQEAMVEVIDRIGAPLVVPMHYFTAENLARFLDRVRPRYDIQTSTTPSAVLSRATLPTKREVLVLPGP
jgi:L-ascorbate metabolism protein UlaG (beta-lactamase superfamily)